MNKDQVKGRVKEATGEVQQKVGKLTGDLDTRAKGQAKEMEGKVQKNYGDAKETVENTARDLETEKLRRDELNRR